MQPTRTDELAVVAIIRAAADRHEVPRRVALAFAWCESRLNPDAEGDLHWHEKEHGALYRKHVLENPRYTWNPMRNVPELWHSYGLFQLLACYHTLGGESPRALLKPETNAERACKEIGRLLRLTKGDVRSTRLAYVGCGFTGALCSEERRAAYLANLGVALERFNREDT